MILNDRQEVYCSTSTSQGFASVGQMLRTKGLEFRETLFRLILNPVPEKNGTVLNAASHYQHLYKSDL